MENQYEVGNNEAIDEEFFEDIKSVKECINVLNRNNYKIKELKRQYNTAVMESKEK